MLEITTIIVGILVSTEQWSYDKILGKDDELGLGRCSCNELLSLFEIFFWCKLIDRELYHGYLCFHVLPLLSLSFKRITALLFSRCDAKAKRIAYPRQ